MVTEAPSTTQGKRLRERLSRGEAMVTPVEVGKGRVGLLISNCLLKEHETRDRKALGEACLAALEQWAEVVLGRCITLLSGLAAPLDRFGVVLWNTQAFVVHRTH